jgi:hypothetical protein
LPREGQGWLETALAVPGLYLEDMLQCFKS